jgi:hypothetical protein
VEAIRVAIARSPQRSARHHSVALGLSTRTVRRILHDDLHLHPYKMQMVHALKPGDYAMRIGFCEHMLQLLEDGPQLIDNLWMSDAHFHLSGYVNKHNFRYWATANPQQLHERPLHSAKVTVWCAISSNGIIDPYFFEKAMQLQLHQHTMFICWKTSSFQSFTHFLCMRTLIVILLVIQPG